MIIWPSMMMISSFIICHHILHKNISFGSVHNSLMKVKKLIIILIERQYIEDVDLFVCQFKFYDVNFIDGFSLHSHITQM